MQKVCVKQKDQRAGLSLKCSSYPSVMSSQRNLTYFIIHLIKKGLAKFAVLKSHYIHMYVNSSARKSSYHKWK